MAKKYTLFDTSAEWTAKHDEVMTHLGIPNSGASTYASLEQVGNAGSSDYEKCIFPVLTSGPYKCDTLFDASDLVDWNGDWFPLIN